MTLSSEAYHDIPRFHVGVDCIIFTVIDDRLKVLLVRRDFDPEKGKWSLIGGFVGAGESVDNAARRVLRELTGIDHAFIRQLGAFGEIDRDPGARVVSVAYFALLKHQDIDPNVIEAHKAEWHDITSLPQLCFDHPKMIDKALACMRGEIINGSLAFSLLPELFTLTQLQTVVESVLGRSLDKRNFRKRISDHPRIVATELIDKESSRRGARLYRCMMHDA